VRLIRLVHEGQVAFYLRMTSDIQRRKVDHLELCATDDVAFRERTTLLECVRLVHQSLPELAVTDLDLSVTMLGKKLRAPLMIAGMTGGTERSAEVNQELSAIAEKRGIGFGLGSQRAMHREPGTAWTYQIRERAPTTLILGNLGAVAAREVESGVLAQLVADIGADGLCLHMNPAQELVQGGGDRDFRGCLAAIERLVRELPVPVIAKETGAGISRATARKLVDVGVRTIDVSGAGGTSWVGVEALRAEGNAKVLGELLWDWGVPTAASVAYAAECGASVIATGGIKNGLDVARALALGADIAGIARPVLQAFMAGGREGAESCVVQVEQQLSAVMLLCGVQRPHDLRGVSRVITGELKDWLA